MDKRLLSLIPKRYLCPFCGKWHENKELHHLGFYDFKYPAEFRCHGGFYGNSYGFYFSDDFFYFSTDSICRKAEKGIRGNIAISSIEESSEFHRVTFDVDFTTTDLVSGYACSCCKLEDKCNVCRLGKQGDGHHIKITLGFEFEQYDYNNKMANVVNIPYKDRGVQEEEQTIDIKENALTEHEDAVSSKAQVFQGPQVKENKEETTMATNNKPFGLDMEFGLNKDESIASTLMGVAVKAAEGWRIYNPEKHEITDIGEMKFGNFPIFMLPTTKLKEGDLIKDSGEFYYVKEVEPEIRAVSPKTGEIKTLIPTKNIMGFQIYTKVKALVGGMKEGFDDKTMLVLAAMGQNGENGNQMNQLLPLLFLKDKTSDEDDLTTLLLLTYMTNPASEGENDQMNQFLPLLLLKDKSGGEDDLTKLLLLSTMNGNNSNPLMSYLMMEKFMGDKE